jgi:murein DD-endopeptidase MepM/ murein hydrolase activator NlpD
MTHPFVARTRRHFGLFGYGLLLVTVFAVLIFHGGQQNVAGALETPQQIAMGSWQGASFPVENFQTYTSPFGLRLSATGGYNQEYHRGLDMAAPEGSYIRNWWTGKVVEVSDDSACGTSVVIESGQWEHIYCHMKGHVETGNGGRYMSDREAGLQIWEGQTIPAGARIGRVGMTGRTTGPHLHWGLKFAKQWVDPALVLRAMYAEQTARGSVSIRP